MEETFPDIDNIDIGLKKVALEKVFFQAAEKGFCTAIWRNPGEEEIHIIVSLSETQPEIAHPELEEMQPGFLISPYENDHNLLHFFIKADLHFIYKEDNLLKFDFDHNLSVKRVDDFLDQTNTIVEAPVSKQSNDTHKRPDILNKDGFIDLIKRSVDNIKQEEFQKVVPSRVEEVDLPDDFNIVSKFVSLCNIHPQAFISLFHLHGKCLWIGASPELLIKIADKKFFYTSAVAGTQSGKDVTHLSEVAWTQKEIEEQAFVSRYIINCFKKIRLREFEENGPRTVKAGGLLHLRTDYKVDLEAVNFPQLGSVMLKLLHPTSAVCGMPKEPASSFLQEYEKIDREFYSGFLGPVNIDSETSLYVNLRCARVQGNKALLYAGAGVTRDSIPEKEWKETELKMNTIKEVLLG